MVLTDRQRADLHAGIYEYLCSRSGDAFARAAEALKEAVPADVERHSGLGAKSNGHNSTPVLEKKWTAIPRLQKKVLELEKQAAQSAKIHAHRVVGDGSSASSSSSRRMLPRLPPTHTLAGHSSVVTCCAVHPVFTVTVSGSEDGSIKVCCV